jgi:predicted Zn-dependent peptidase
MIAMTNYPGLGLQSRFAPRAKPPAGGAVRHAKTVLENGIRVVTEAMPEVRSLALGVIIDAGPQDEAAEHAGLAHLCEHLIFQGTSNRNAAAIAQLMDLAGGHVGGFTARDYTCYFAHLLDEHYTYGLDLLGDLCLNSIFPEESVRREKEAIVHEIEADQDQPIERAHQLLKNQIWGGHALGRPIAGTPETLRGLTREDIIYFAQGQYLPNRIIIAAAGNLDHEDFTAQARDAFWRLLGEGTARHRPAVEHRPGLVIEERPVNQAYFCLSIPAPAFCHESRYRWHVLNNLLGGGISSRLYRTLREERGLVYAVGSEYQAYRDAGLLVIEGSTAPEHVLQVLSIILLRLGRLAFGLEPASDEEAWRANLQLRRQHLLAGESTGTRMSRLATQELYFGRHLSAEEILAHIEAVDEGDLNQLAADELRTAVSQAALALVAPLAPTQFSRPALQDLLGSFTQS